MSHTRSRVWVVLKVPSALDLQEPMWGAQALQAGFHGGHLCSGGNPEEALVPNHWVALSHSLQDTE